MTALFAVVLVLFVLSYKLFKDRENELKKERDRYEVMAKQYERIQRVDKSIASLTKDGNYFIYDSTYKKHILNIPVQFETKSPDINPIYYRSLTAAGRKILELVNSFKKEENIRYLVIIEGQASKDDYLNNYELSYQRALSLIRLWNTHAITFDPSLCEVIIGGSGQYGVPRDLPDNPPRNQRFLIQIIPKIGK